MSKKIRVSDDELKIINAYRQGNKSEEVEKTEKEETDMKGNNLKKAGIIAGAVALLGGAGYGVYRLFKKKSWDDDFDDSFDEEDDSFDEEFNEVAPATESKEETD